MPQMSPLNWFFLFIFFTITYLIFAASMYFNMIPLSPKTKTSTKNKLINLTWKW